MLKIIPPVTLQLTALSSPTTTSDTECSTADAAILSTAGTSPLLRRQQQPEFFDTPILSVDVQHRLRQGDLAVMKDGTHMTPPRDLKK